MKFHTAQQPLPMMMMMMMMMLLCIATVSASRTIDFDSGDDNDRAGDYSGGDYDGGWDKARDTKMMLPFVIFMLLNASLVGTVVKFGGRSTPKDDQSKKTSWTRALFVRS